MACLINSGNLPSIHQNKIETRPNARGREDRSVSETTEHAVPAQVSRAHPFTEVSDGASRRTLPVAGHHVTLFLRYIVEHLPWARNHWNSRNTALKERIKNPCSHEPCFLVEEVVGFYPVELLRCLLVILRYVDLSGHLLIWSIG